MKYQNQCIISQISWHEKLKNLFNSKPSQQNLGAQILNFELYIFIKYYKYVSLNAINDESHVRKRNNVFNRVDLLVIPI